MRNTRDSPELVLFHGSYESLKVVEELEERHEALETWK